MFSDYNVLEYFISLQEKIKPTVSIEVGAFDADFSKHMAEYGIPVYAFEASYPVYDKYRSSLENINYINKAVSDYDGTITFLFNRNIYYDSQDPSDIGFNSIKPRSDTDVVDTSTVECVTLDSYFADLKEERIALWIDCEGANKEVLLGAKNILSITESIVIEVEYQEVWHDAWLRDDVVNFLESMDFVLIKEEPSGFPQNNCIFIKKKYLSL